MSHPAAVITISSSTLFVTAHPFQGPFVSLAIAFNGNECAHATDGGRIAPMAGFHQELGVGVHEGDAHGDQAPVGETEVSVVPELFDR